MNFGTVVRIVLRVAIVVVLMGVAPQHRVAAQNAEAKPVPKAKFVLRQFRVGKSFQFVRLNTVSGECWLVSGDDFVLIFDNEAIPAGDYDVSLLTDDTNWSLFRIDQRSGATWQLRKKWFKIKEPAAKEK